MNREDIKTLDNVEKDMIYVRKSLDRIDKHLTKLNSQVEKNVEFRSRQKELHRICPIASGKNYFRSTALLSGLVASIITLVGSVIVVLL